VEIRPKKVLIVKTERSDNLRTIVELENDHSIPQQPIGGSGLSSPKNGVTF